MTERHRKRQRVDHRQRDRQRQVETEKTTEDTLTCREREREKLTEHDVFFWNFKAHMPVTYVLQQSHNSFPKSPTNWVHCLNVWIYGAIIIHTTIDRNPTSYLDIFVLFTADWNKNWQWPQSLVFRSRCFEFDMLFSKRSVKHWRFY